MHSLYTQFMILPSPQKSSSLSRMLHGPKLPLVPQNVPPWSCARDVFCLQNNWWALHLGGFDARLMTLLWRVRLHQARTVHQTWCPGVVHILSIRTQNTPMYRCTSWGCAYWPLNCFSFCRPPKETATEEDYYLAEWDAEVRVFVYVCNVRSAGICAIYVLWDLCCLEFTYYLAEWDAEVRACGKHVLPCSAHQEGVRTRMKKSFPIGYKDNNC